MNRLRSPALVVAVATALASTTGYCVLQKGDPPVLVSPPETSAPTRLFREPILPYPLIDPT